LHGSIAIRSRNDAELIAGQVRRGVAPGLLIEKIEYVRPEVAVHPLTDFDGLGNGHVGSKCAKRPGIPVEARGIAEGIRSRIRPALKRIYVEEVIYARIEAIAGSRGCDPIIGQHVW
jgi:hypothetical protein